MNPPTSPEQSSLQSQKILDEQKAAQNPDYFYDRSPWLQHYAKVIKNTESFTVLRAVGKTHASAQLTLSEVSKHNNIDIIRNREIGHFQGKLSDGKYVLASVIPNKN
jgi:hypothetical protein